MPAKKQATKNKNLQIIQNKDTKKDNKTQNQKNEPKFVKNYVEIKNDQYSSKSLKSSQKITINIFLV